MEPTPANNLDFYIPPKGHRQLAKERLNRQREDMFSRRSDKANTSFHPVTGERCQVVKGYDSAPKQAYIAGSEREAAALEAERSRKEALWAAAATAGQERRRLWHITGFRFERSHFRTSEDPDSPYHFANKAKLEAANKRLLRTGHVQEPYEPYYHDGITFCEPAKVPGPVVTVLAVTCNEEEGEVRELAAQVAPESGSPLQPDVPGNRNNVLGPSVARKQRSVQLAENMYQDLVHRQATLTGTASGSPESLQVQLPTSELAYSLRPSYVANHSVREEDVPARASRPSTRSAKYEQHQQTAQGQFTASQLPTLTAAPRSHSGLSDMDSTLGSTAHRRSTTHSHHLPAESKEMRLYAVHLRRTIGDEDMAMVRRQEPPRNGVPVQLPETWLSPMTFTS